MKADEKSSAFFILHKIKFPNREYYISNQQTEINQKKRNYNYEQLKTYHNRNILETYHVTSIEI